MANNRLYLRCKDCAGESKKRPEYEIMIAKYYPGTGWYRYHDDTGERVDRFFDAHQHGSPLGCYIDSYLETAEEEH